MKGVFKLMAARKQEQARAVYRRMWSDCLATTGRKTGDDQVCSIRMCILHHYSTAVVPILPSRDKSSLRVLDIVTVSLRGRFGKVGSYNREFAKEWAQKLERAIGRNGERLDPTKVKSILDKGTEMDGISLVGVRRGVCTYTWHNRLFCDWVGSRQRRGTLIPFAFVSVISPYATVTRFSQ